MPIDEAALEAAIEEVRESLQRPENVERAYLQFVITEVVTKLMMHESVAGEITNGVPTFTKTDEGSSANDDGTIEQCHTTHLSLFGHEVFSWKSCITGAGTGSGHGTIIPEHATIE